MLKFLKQRLIILVMAIVIPIVATLINDAYYTPERVLPTISNITYSVQEDFILIGCEVYSVKQVRNAEVHFNDEIVEMKYVKSVSGQADRVRYSVTIPTLEEDTEIKIVAYNNQGDSSTYIVEK